MSYVLASGIITQSGTDTTYNSISSIAGVTTTVDNGVTYYNLGDLQLRITGTQYHNPEKEIIIITHDTTLTADGNEALLINQPTNSYLNITSWSREGGFLVAATGTPHNLVSGDAVEIRSTNITSYHRKYRVKSSTTYTVTLDNTNYTSYETLPTTLGQITKRACYNYGFEKTVNGRTRYADGTGIFITGTSTSTFNEGAAGFRVGAGGFFWARGGTIITNRHFAQSGAIDLSELNLVGTRLGDTRSWGRGVAKKVKLINSANNNTMNLDEAGFILAESYFGENLSDPYSEIILKDLDGSQNVIGTEIGHYNSVDWPHRDWIIINSYNGSNVRGMWRGNNGTNQRGVMIVKKEVSFNFKDTSSSPINGVKLHLIDNPSAYAKNVTFPAPTSASYTTQPVNSIGVYNSGDGSISYNYTNPIEYSYTSDASGDIPTFQVTTATQILEYNSTNSSALTANGGPYAIPSFNGTWRETDNLVPAYSDWDTDRFGGFYRMDRRSVSNTDADDFTFNFCTYGLALSQSTQTLKGGGELAVNWVLFDDASITETNKGTVDAYTTIDNPEQFYDRAKSFLYDNYAGETSTIVSRSGNTINAGSYNITVDANAASVFAFDGTTITIKATQFIGNITSSGTFSLLNDAEILGSYGAETVLPWTVTNVEAGSTIQLFNVTGDNEIENYITAGSGTKITATGSYGTADAVVGDTIRLRVTCQVGLEALEPFETFGVATAAGIAFRADQVADTIYNANNIDGSNITGIALTPDYTNIQIDLDDDEAPYQITAQEIYNYYAYIITTVEGIANFFGAISPIDRMNYRINASVAPIKIQNTGTTDVVINGGRLYRDDNVSIIDTNSATGAGTGSLVHDTGFLLQYLQPQVEAAISTVAQDTDMQTVKTDVANIKKKANLITGLL